MKYTLILILSFFSFLASAQEEDQKLILKTKNLKTEYSFQIGSYVNLQLYSTKKINGRINQFVEDGFIVAADTVYLSKVKKMNGKEDGNGMQLFGNLLLISGLGYVTISSMRNFFEDETPVVEPQAIQFGIIAVAGGIVLKQIFNPVVRIKKKEQLSIKR